ncbi:hypothetical protein [uncultured Gammaproteobacteria bacterium]|nr:hypothetical protein [uncultured Gammaproteobacteria bacterium]
MIKTYIKITEKIRAIQYTGDNLEEVLEFCGDSNAFFKRNEGLFISPKLDCVTRCAVIPKATIGDFIIRGIKGGYYPCEPGIFKYTYEEEKT